MEENADGLAIVSELPPPPQLFTLYKDGPDAGPAPPPIPDGTYYMFGLPYTQQHNVPDLFEGTPEKRLYSAELQQLKTPNDAQTASSFRNELKRLNRSLLASYLQLVDLLIRSPSHHRKKIEDLEQLLLNMHNLINSFRPHQAREMLIEMLKLQLDRQNEAIAEVHRAIEESKQTLSQAYSDLTEKVEILDPAAYGPKRIATYPSPKKPGKRKDEVRSEDKRAKPEGIAMVKESAIDSLFGELDAVSD